MVETALKETKIALISSNPVSILHVDDDVAFLNMAKQCLEMHANIEVESVQSVQEALETLKTKKFDVIVSDYQMKGKDGLEFLNDIKAAGITTPFILFSGKSRD
jgi:CheY-like chemotaxis protein